MLSVKLCMVNSDEMEGKIEKFVENIGYFIEKKNIYLRTKIIVELLFNAYHYLIHRWNILRFNFNLY